MGVGVGCGVWAVRAPAASPMLPAFPFSWMAYPSPPACLAPRPRFPSPLPAAPPPVPPLAPTCATSAMKASRCVLFLEHRSCAKLAAAVLGLYMSSRMS